MTPTPPAWNARTRSLYVNPRLFERLGLAADVEEATCVDEYVEKILTDHLAAKYPTLETEFEAVQKARKKMLEETRERLKAKP